MKKIALISFLILNLTFPLPAYAQGVSDIAATASLEATSDGAKSKKSITRYAQKGLITIDFKNADIKNVLEALALKGNVNIVASPDVVGSVTMNLRDVPWKSAFETILNTYGYGYEQDRNIYQVYPIAAIAVERVEEIRSEVIELEHLGVEGVKEALEGALSPLGSIEAIAGTNQIIISDSTSSLKQTINLIDQIDVRMPQVLVEAKIIRTALSEGENLGIDWSTIIRASGSKRPTTFPFDYTGDNRGPDDRIKKAGFIPGAQTEILDTTTDTATGATSTSEEVEFAKEFGFPYAERDAFSFGTLDFSQFTAVLNVIKQRKSTKIVSNPRIVVLNHQAAVVQVGGEVGIPLFERNETTGAFEVSGFEERDFGIVLNVTPHISAKREIVLDVKPQVTQFLGFIPIGGTNLASPQFETINARTRVMINDGDTLVIGGLISDKEDDDRTKVPLLNRIPGLGWLFKSLARDPGNNSKTETIFFITVTLIDDAYSEASLAKWRQQQKDYDEFRKYSEESYFIEHETEQAEKEAEEAKKEAEKADKKAAKKEAKLAAKEAKRAAKEAKKAAKEAMKNSR
jgi:type IV pilus assembly protein PilQ